MAKGSKRLRDLMEIARRVMEPGVKDAIGVWSFAPYFQPAFDAVKAAPGRPKRMLNEEIAHIVGTVVWWMGDGHQSLAFDEVEPYCDAGYQFRVVFEAGFSSGVDAAYEQDKQDMPLASAPN